VPSHRAPRPLVAGVALAAALVVIAGCSKGSSPTVTPSASSSGAGTAVARIANEVPAAIRSNGTLVVAADATYAPDEFIGSDGKTVVGMDADLAKALAAVMGLKVKVVNATFDSIIPGLQSGKYDLGMSSFTDTKKREQTVDFVTYFSSGEAFYVKAQGGPSIQALADLCGHAVAVETGTTELDDANTQAAKCHAAGKPAEHVKSYPDQNTANLALTSGAADVGFLDSQVAGYVVAQSHGQFKLSGPAFAVAPYGIAIPKNNGMATPILDALKQLMSDGTYTAILARWGVSSGAISNPVINGAQS